MTTGYGSEFWLGNGATPSVLTEVGEVTALEPGGSEWETTEKTHFKSPDRYREFLKTMRSGGSGSVTVNWKPGDATDVLLSAAVDDPEARPYKFVFPTEDDETWEASGDALVLSRTPTIEMDAVMSCTLSLLFTGARAEAAGV